MFLKKKLIEASKKLKMKSIILQCKPSQSLVNNQGNTSTISHLQTEALNKLILESRYVISKIWLYNSYGFSKIEKKIVFNCNNGQYEQEYLSSYLVRHGFCLFGTRKN